jgi:hypothetical protein
MATQQTAPQILDRHFLEIRCGLLDLAAALDRIDRSEDASKACDDPRMAKIQQGLTILLNEQGQRAEQIQLLFSDEYVAGWNAAASHGK